MIYGKEYHYFTCSSSPNLISKEIFFVFAFLSDNKLQHPHPAYDTESVNAMQPMLHLMTLLSLFLKIQMGEHFGGVHKKILRGDATAWNLTFLFSFLFPVNVVTCLDIQLPLSLFASGDTMLCEDLFYLFIRRKQFVIRNFTDVDKVIEKLLFKGWFPFRANCSGSELSIVKKVISKSRATIRTEWKSALTESQTWSTKVACIILYSFLSLHSVNETYVVK